MFINESINEKANETTKNSIIKLPINTPFYNAEDTTGDKIYVDDSLYERSFLDFWAENTGYSVSDKLRCMNFYCLNSGENKQDIIGAHIVLNKSKRKLSKGDKFYIVPLCRKCNHYTNDKEMRIDHTIKAPMLFWTGKSGSYSTKYINYET